MDKSAKSLISRRKSINSLISNSSMISRLSSFITNISSGYPVEGFFYWDSIEIPVKCIKDINNNIIIIPTTERFLPKDECLYVMKNVDDNITIPSLQKEIKIMGEGKKVEIENIPIYVYIIGKNTIRDVFLLSERNGKTIVSGLSLKPK